VHCQSAGYAPVKSHVQHLACSSSSTTNTGISLTPISVAAGNANNTILHTTAHRCGDLLGTTRLLLHWLTTCRAEYSYQTLSQHFYHQSAVQPMKQPATHNQPVADVGALAAYVVAAVEPVQLFGAVTKL
jgi:hypothetical protein